MENKIITIQEAIKQGFKYALLNDDEVCTPLSDLTEEDFETEEVYLMGKEASNNVIENESIINLIIDKHSDDPTVIFREDHLHESFIENMEDILRDEDVLKAEAALCEAIKNATKKMKLGCYQPSKLTLVFN